MSNKILIIIMLVILVSGVLLGALEFNANNEEKTPSSRTFNFESIGDGAVTIILSPKSYNNGELLVDVSVDTHSVDLSQFNLMEIITLEYDKNSIKSISAPNLQGHHTSGAVIFPVDTAPTNYKFIIEGFTSVT
ncbi:MAG TPA: hypothetical protein VJH20_00040 [Candidatus Nanoarchaeia archaeon]|nr:hypothetical protein [Candidatus Nanoarchaeia archaeon]